MKKVLAMLLALVMVLSLCACGAAEEEAAPAAEEVAPAAEEAAPAAEEAAAPVAEAAAEGDFEAYKQYVVAYATAGAPTEEEGAEVAAAINACASYEEMTAVSQLTVLLENVVMSYDEWVAAGCPAADTSNMTAGDPGAGSGEASGEASAEPAA